MKRGDSDQKSRNMDSDEKVFRKKIQIRLSKIKISDYENIANINLPDFDIGKGFNYSDIANIKIDKENDVNDDYNDISNIKINDEESNIEMTQKKRKRTSGIETPKKRERMSEIETPKKRKRTSEVETPKNKKTSGITTPVTSGNHKLEPTRVSTRAIKRRIASDFLVENLSSPKSSPIAAAARTSSTTDVLGTPKHSIKSLTPQLRRRSTLKTPATPLDRARRALHASRCPDALSCREQEFDTIYRFILRKIETRTGGCMYISGIPGTGKTATVLRVVKKLELDYEAGDIPFFNFVEINSFNLTDPRQAYTKFWNSLTGENLSAEQAKNKLQKKFTSSKSKKDITVLLIDELDCLCNRKQDVICDILDWPTRQGSHLIVLTVANTMDLPERTLKGKVSSRMGLTRVAFQPYSYQQLQNIILDRLTGNKSFNPDAVQLAARKVAAVSGDCRRALDICCKAIELVYEKRGPDATVAIADVEEAVNLIMSNRMVKAIKNCSLQEQLVLRAIRDETLKTGTEMCSLNDVYQQYTALCALEGVKCLYIEDVDNVCVRLNDRFIMVDDKISISKKNLSLNVSADDIHYALTFKT